jgi:hypothetical protein
MINNRRSRTASWVILAGCMVAAVLPIAKSGAADDSQLNRMWEVWRKRSIAVSTLHANLIENGSGIAAFCRHRSEWATLHSNRETLRRGHLAVSGNNIRFDRLAWEYDDQIAGIIPYNHEVYLDDFRAQIATKRFNLALFSGCSTPMLEERDPASYVSAFDGKKRVALWARAAPEFSSAVVWDSLPFEGCSDLYFDSFLDAVPSLDEIVYQPVLTIYRPFHPWYGGLDPERCSLVRQGVVIGGRECLLIKERARQGTEFSRLFFVCPALDFALLRYYADAGPFPHLQIDIDYKKVEELGWVPHGWVINRFNASTGEILEAASIDVTDLSINMPAEHNEIFSIEFPERTWVRNLETDEQVLIRADGSQRRVLDFEFRSLASHRQLIDSESGQAGDVSTASSDATWWNTLCGVAIGGGGALVALGIVRFWRS